MNYKTFGKFLIIIWGILFSIIGGVVFRLGLMGNTAAVFVFIATINNFMICLLGVYSLIKELKEEKEE